VTLAIGFTLFLIVSQAFQSSTNNAERRLALEKGAPRYRPSTT